MRRWPSIGARWFRNGAIAVSLVAASVAGPQPVGAASTGGVTRQIPSSGTATFAVAGAPSSTAGIEGFETVGTTDGAGPNRSNSGHSGSPVGPITQPH
ncbi:MAG: hypothetical protein ACXVB2_23615, partial [Isosphaeraceae bacterium]